MKKPLVFYIISAVFGVLGLAVSNLYYYMPEERRSFWVILAAALKLTLSSVFFLYARKLHKKKL